MQTVLSTLRAEARLLHRRVQNQDPTSIQRISKSIPELRKSIPEQIPALVKRRHCLAAIARELGFNGWPHLAGYRLLNAETTVRTSERCSIRKIRAPIGISGRRPAQGLVARSRAGSPL